MIVFAALLLVFQDGPVSASPQPAPAPALAPSADASPPAAAAEPPPPVQLVPPPPPLVVPSALPEPAPIVPSAATPAEAPEPAASLPVGPRPYRPAPIAPSVPDQEDEESVELPPGPRPYNSLPSTPAPAPSGNRPYEASGWVSEEAYESRVRTSALAAQNQRGSLDGAWLVTGADGARLYGLQLSDDGRGGIEGAWRDANGLPGLRSGFIASASRDGPTLTLRFFERNGTRPVVLTLQPGPDGFSWTGAVDRADGHRTVAMRPL